MSKEESEGVRLVQHLLRHLDDAAALQENTIARTILEVQAGEEAAGFNNRSALAHLRTKVLMAAKMLLSDHSGSERAKAAAKRQYEIVVRCDLGSELHRVVAAELGLSRRQFYRERLRACAHLALFLTQRPRDPATVYVLPSEFDLRLKCAVGLRNYGQIDAALTILESLCADAETPVHRIRAHCEMAIALCDAGRLHTAREVLARAKESFLAQQIPETYRAVCFAEIERVASLIQWGGGGLHEAMEINERALEALRGDALAHERGIELGALIAIALAWQYREMGNVSASLGFLRQARDFLDQLRDPAPELRASLLGNFATTYALTAGGIATALAQLNEHLEFAQRHNLQRAAADSLSTLCMIHTQRRDFRTALAHGRSALVLARTISGVEDFAYCALNVSRIEAALGNTAEALALVREVRARLGTDLTMSVFTDMSEAEALLKAGAFAQGNALAKRCASRFAGLGMDRYLGSALRMEAEGLAALGNHRGAVATIGSAIEVLERRGHTFSLAQAYEASARITGNARHGDTAEELFAILSA
jgi:tetratricopeptide (TPR) repeat protein